MCCDRWSSCRSVLEEETGAVGAGRNGYSCNTRKTRGVAIKRSIDGIFAQGHGCVRRNISRSAAHILGLHGDGSRGSRTLSDGNAESWKKEGQLRRGRCDSDALIAVAAGDCEGVCLR